MSCGEGEDLALPQAEARSEPQSELVALGELVANGEDSLSAPRNELLGIGSWLAHGGALHGFFGINSSSTAAVKMVETLAT
jgi:hypothetical protein